MIKHAIIDEQQVQVQGTPSWQRNARSEREYAQLEVANDRKQRYEMYRLCELVKGDDTIEQYLIQADQNRLEAPNYYIHTLMLVETMAIFDTIYPTSRSFRTRTGQQLTLRDILDVYIREIAFYQDIEIDYEEGSYLDKKLTQKEYDGQNMSSILTNLFNAVKANAKCYYDKTAKKWVLYPQFYKHRNSTIDPTGDTYYYQQNNLDYATKAKVQAKNAIYEDLVLDWFPSKTGYIIPRSDAYVMSESELQYELESSVIAFVQVIAVDINYREIWFQDNDLQEEFLTADTVDITSNVVTQEEWDSLLTENVFDNKYIETDPMRENHIRYDIDSNTIYGLFEASGLFGFNNTDFLKNAIRYNLEPKHAADHDPTYSAPIEYEIFNDITNIKLRVKYIKQRDIDYTTNRMNSQDMVASTMLYSQAASRIDLGKQKENLSTLVNRLGNNTEFITKMFGKDETTWQVFDYTADGKTIVEAKYTEYANGTYGEFELAENFANIKAEESISREPNPYTITGKKFMTNVIEENYIIFSEDPDTNDTILSTNGIDGVRDSFESNPNEDRKIEFAVYSNPQNDKLHMPVMSGGDGLTSTFHVHWRRPIIAGWYLDEVDNATIKQPIIYTGQDPLFELDNYGLYFSNTTGNIEDTGDYPRIEETQDIQDNALTTEEYKPIDLGINDSFAYTLALHAMTNSRDIIVGDRFMELLPLHNPADRTLNLYKADSPLNIGDQEKRGGMLPVQDGFITYTRSQQKLEVGSNTDQFDYWAIIDNEDRILIASNGPKTVYFSVKKKMKPLII